MDNKKKKVSFLLVLTMFFTLIPAMSCFAATNVSASTSLTQTTGSLNTDSLVVTPTISTNVIPTVKVTPTLTPTPDPTAFGIVVMKGSGTAGTTVIIPISVKNLPAEHLDALNFVVKYDSTQLAFVGASKGAIVPANGAIYTNGNTSGTLGILYADESNDNTGYISTAGTLVNLIFTLSSNATPLAFNTITAEAISAATAAVDSSGNNVEISKIVVTNYNTSIITPTPTISPLPLPVSPSFVTFNKLAPADITVAITDSFKATNPIVSVYNGSGRVFSGIQQQITTTTTGYNEKFFKSYLNTLPLGTNIITFKFKDGETEHLYINVVKPDILIQPSSVTFNKLAPADITVAITDTNKVTNPIVSVYNGSGRVFSGIQQQITTTTTGYSEKLFKSYLNTLPIGTNIITFNFKDGTKATLNINVLSD
ncbi:MAG: hypothetical protein Q8900_07180 [Bacillota bacterium]|nr:hypothetical protein [Bacillota bacterium]